MSEQKFYGMTVNVVGGQTYWQIGGYESVADLISHVKRYSKGRKHILVYQENEQSELVFVDHLNAGTY